MEHLKFTAENAREITATSDGLFEAVLSRCVEEIKVAAEKGKYAIHFEISSTESGIKERLIDHLKTCSFEPCGHNFYRFGISWEPSFEENATHPESEVANV